jgi:predicted DNA-binding transcriptional regulator YafY
MRRADRLLQIVQILRRHGRPVTASALAEEVEVATRTVYRDIAALQAARVPVEGEAGVGYMLRPGYDLPPLMFTAEEVDAVALGARMVVERGDFELARAARDVLAKVEAVVPRTVADQWWKAALLVPHPLEDGVSFGRFVPMIRQAVRASRKLRISYIDANASRSERTIWPLGLYLFSHVTLVCAWCELRDGYRAFRSERIEDCELLVDGFDPRGGALMNEFLRSFSGKA